MIRVVPPKRGLPQLIMGERVLPVRENIATKKLPTIGQSQSVHLKTRRETLKIVDHHRLSRRLHQLKLTITLTELPILKTSWPELRYE
jgi:hypothetical protein